MSGSVLDRLLDRGRGHVVADVQASVRRDLAALLNARRPWEDLPDRFAALRDSILGYGLPDFAAGAFNAPAARETLRREIEQAIRRFEPRLSDVKVTLLDSRSTMTPILRIRVAGVLRIPGGDSEPVTFDTALDTASADMTVGDAAYG